MLSLSRRRRRDELERLAEDAYSERVRLEAPYWDALDHAGGIVPDMHRVAGRFRMGFEFTTLPAWTLRRPVLHGSPKSCSVVRGNIDAIIAAIVAVGVPTTREAVLAWFVAHPRRASRAEARRYALQAVQADLMERLNVALGLAS